MGWCPIHELFSKAIISWQLTWLNFYSTLPNLCSNPHKTASWTSQLRYQLHSQYLRFQVSHRQEDLLATLEVAKPEILLGTAALGSGLGSGGRWGELVVVVLQERGPIPGPKTGLLSNTWKWIVWGDTCADKARDFTGKGHPGREQEGQGAQEDSSAGGLQFYGDGISFQVVISQSFWLRVLPGGAPLVQPRWMPERRILGGGQTGGVSFRPFQNSSSWWWLISSMFLTRTSCHKTTHANGYYGVWPGWVVSISVLPLTVRVGSRGGRG